jgi:leucyl aminopeptidase
MSHEIEVKTSDNRPQTEDCDALVLFIAEKESSAFEAFRQVDQTLGKALSALLKQEHFGGKVGDTITYHASGGISAGRIVLAGVGKKRDLNEEVLRRASAAAAIAARNAACSRVGFTLPSGVKPKPEALCGAIIEGALLGAYRYLRFKTKEEELEPEKRINRVSVLAGKGQSVRDAVSRAKIYADAACFARDLVNEPANTLNPAVLAQKAKAVAKESGLHYRVIEAAELEKMGAGAILGVGRGSTVPPCLIQVSYRPRGKTRKRIALVGKGITFDSGGLSLKPAKHMETMKCDMAGAAAVLATLKVLPKLKPDCEVIGVLCAAENMPSGRAIRPGDVLKAMNGKSIEVMNTDAEGRLVLSDGLSWAVKQGAHEMIDLATLTGACIVALGPYVAGVMGNDVRLIRGIIDAGTRAGESFWELPIPDDYEFMIKSDIADMKNLAPNSEAGAIQGALFLRQFIGKTKWAHLDIAGPAWNDKDFFHVTKNGTGFGVRTLLNYLTKL